MAKDDHMNLRSAFEQTPVFWKEVGTIGVTRITERTLRGRGVSTSDKEYAFPAYSQSYADYKASGFQSRRGTGRIPSLAGESLDRQTAPPNFRLRNKTLRSNRIKAVTAKSVVFGWSGEEGGIVDNHMTRGKYRVGGLTDKDQDFVVDFANDWHQKRWNKMTRSVNKTIDIRF